MTRAFNSTLPVGVTLEDIPLESKKEPKDIEETTPSPLAREEWLLTPGERKPFGGFPHWVFTLI